MLKTVKKWALWIVVTLAVLTALLWFPVKWTREYYVKDAYYQEVSGYVHGVEPLIAETAFWEANKRSLLTPEQRGTFYTRLDNLEDRSKDVVLIGFTNLDSDTYGKLITDIVDEVQSTCARRVDKQMGIDRSFDAYDRKEWEKQFKEELADYNDVVQMDGLHNSLTWNYAGVLWEKSFGTKYTMQKLAEDRAEYERDRKELDALLQKYGKLKQ
jgi:hypothetical protein